MHFNFHNLAVSKYVLGLAELSEGPKVLSLNFASGYQTLRVKNK